MATLSLLFSRVRDLESWDLFQELLVFSCVLLDDKLSQESGAGSSLVSWSRVRNCLAPRGCLFSANLRDTHVSLPSRLYQRL